MESENMGTILPRAPVSLIGIQKQSVVVRVSDADYTFARKGIHCKFRDRQGSGRYEIRAPPHSRECIGKRTLIDALKMRWQTM